MPANPSPPDGPTLQRFLLGRLSAAEALAVEEYIDGQGRIGMLTPLRSPESGC